MMIIMMISLFFAALIRGREAEILSDFDYYCNNIGGGRGRLVMITKFLTFNSTKLKKLLTISFMVN